MSRHVTLPTDRFSGPTWDALSPGARRLHVSSWVACNEQGHVSLATVEAIYRRWGERFNEDEGVDLASIVRDLERLGFITKPRRRADGYFVRISGAWLS